MASAAEGDMAGPGEAGTMGTGPRLPGEADTGHHRGAATVRRSTEGATGPRPVDTEDEAPVGRRHRIRETHLSMTMGTTGDLRQRAAMVHRAYMAPDSSPLPPLGTGTPKREPMRHIIRKLSSPEPSLHHLCQGLMVPSLPDKRWRWMQLLAAPSSNLEATHNTASGTRMLTLLACWRCNKRERRLARTVKTSKSGISSPPILLHQFF